MSAINDVKTVRKQYENASKLNTRISIHDKYSVNKQGFGNWIASHYRISEGMRVLELGCGTGTMWKGQDGLISKCSQLVLTDFSEGMVRAAHDNVGDFPNVTYCVAGIQAIPFEANSFDAVIANMMLYHVPDLGKGLSEVKRVLKEGGSFYCATYGERGITAYIADLLKPYGVEDRVNRNFTLQNGEQILKQVFSSVEKREYVDSLEVANLDDMLDYLYSLTSMTDICHVERETVRSVLAQNTVDGVLKVPKEYGMFICG